MTKDHSSPDKVPAPQPPQPVESPHAAPAAEVAAALGVEPEEGLSPAEARARLKRHGANLLRRQKPKSAFLILVHQFRSIVVLLLVGAAALSAMLGDLAETVAIILVLLVNTAIGFFTELRAARSMEALFAIAEVLARVRRGGAVRLVDAHELVPGDIVLLEAGDMVTADMRVLTASNLHGDESVLTGESVPVLKSADPAAPDAVLGDRTSMVFKGTAITQGAGEAVVTATGMHSEIGRIAALTQAARSDASPLERRLDRLGRRLVGLTLVLAAVTIALGILRGQDIAIMVQTGVALAVAAIPEGLPIVATLCLARGMLRMARRNALINRLSSVETLGATTLIVTDKTGTLTENRMEVVRYILPGGDLEFDADAPGDVNGDPELAWALCVGANCNTADLGDGADGSAIGDPMEQAMLRAARNAGFDHRAYCGIGPPVVVHAFDQDRLMMASVHADASGFLYLVKGAPEAVIERATTIMGAGGPEPMTEALRDRWLERTRAATAGGLRSLALATRHGDRPDADPFKGLALVGLVCLADPLRDDVRAAIDACRGAGIDVAMITGDHPATAAAIAAQAGISGPDPKVLTGRALARFDPADPDPALAERVRATRVFARVAPATKLALVSFFQRQGLIVAMTGDGVNDAPALKKADIGVAMGQRGTQVAREASDMVLLDDAFSTIVEAVAQGRVIFENIRKFVVYLMSCNVSEVMVVALAVGAGLPAPLLPLQILFLNLVTDVFPAFALGLGRGGGAAMRAPPRDPAEPIVDRPHWTRIGALGSLIAAATLAAFALALFWPQLDTARAVTVAFLTIALAQLWNVFNMRGPGSDLILNDVTRNPFVWMALALCAGLIAGAVWLPALSELFRLPSPGLEGVGLALGLSLVPLAAGQALIALHPIGPRRSGRGAASLGPTP